MIGMLDVFEARIASGEDTMRSRARKRSIFVVSSSTNRLHDEIPVVHRVEVVSEAHSIEHRRRGRDLALRLGSFEGGLHPFTAGFYGSWVGLAHHDVHACPCADLSDACAHRTGSDDAHSMHDPTIGTSF
jgi:hypothetical protein